MGERLLCKQEVIGSIPFTSTTDRATRCVVRVKRAAAVRKHRESAPGASKGTGVALCGFRGARAPLDMNDAMRHSVGDRVKQCLRRAFGLEAC